MRIKKEIADIQNSMQIKDKWEGTDNLKYLEIEKKSKYIKKIYFDIQNKIYTSYFDNLLKRTENDLEVNMILKKLQVKNYWNQGR